MGCFSPASITKRVVRWVVARDPDDRRSKRIELTERGLGVRRAIREAVREIEAEWKRELGSAEFARLRRLLVELRDTDVVRELYGPPGS